MPEEKIFIKEWIPADFIAYRKYCENKYGKIPFSK